MADEAGAGRGGRAVPDLDVPSMRPSTPRVSAPPRSQAPKVQLDDLGDDFGAHFERGGASSMQPSPHVSFGPPGRKQVAIDVSMGGGDGDFGDMEIERGGGTSLPPMSSGRPTPSGRPSIVGGPTSRPSLAASASSGIELGSTRPRPSRGARTRRGPSSIETMVGWFVTIVTTAGAFAVLVRIVHGHHAPRSFTELLPHAFDASSAKQSGAFALTALALSIAVGYGGLKARGRSWAMVGSAALLLLAALAMVTVTLVATDETPTPPDGALVIPYLMPLAIVLFGFGVASRGLPYWKDRGGRRLLTLVVGLLGGALVFTGIELSGVAGFLPTLH